VVDERIRESSALGAALQLEGVQRLEVTAGLTKLWKDHLYPHWQGSQGDVVGLTTRSVWDGLSQQAHGQFRKARIVGVHQLGSTSEYYQHMIDAPLGAQIAIPDIAAGTSQWPQDLARMLARSSSQPVRVREPRLYGPGIPADGLCQQLVSWIIE